MNKKNKKITSEKCHVSFPEHVCCHFLVCCIFTYITIKLSKWISLNNLPNQLTWFSYNDKTVQIKLSISVLFFWIFFSVRLLSVLRGHSGVFIPATTANELRLRRIFYPTCYPLHLFTYLNSWERASIFPFECSMLNKGTRPFTCINRCVRPCFSRNRLKHFCLQTLFTSIWHSPIYN